jgi:hypothetical protein
MTTQESDSKLLRGDLKPVQESGARDEVADDLRISAPSLDNRAWVH